MEKEDPKLEEFFKNLAIYLAIMEKYGSYLLIIGYSIFVHVADLDIREENEPEIPITEDAAALLVIGEKLVLCGLIVLWYVAKTRIYQINSKNELLGLNISLVPYEKLSNAYFLSVLANIARVDALTEIALLDPNEEALV